MGSTSSPTVICDNDMPQHTRGEWTVFFFPVSIDVTICFSQYYSTECMEWGSRCII